MKVIRLLAVPQLLEEVEDLAIKKHTTTSVCGYITCAICQFLSEQDQVTPKLLEQINFQLIRPYIEKVMQAVAKNRRVELKKYMKQMTEAQKKSYMRDWVAGYEICDYLQNIRDKMVNPYVYFFQQVAYDHPEALQTVKFEEAERIKDQAVFKGHMYFYSSFHPTTTNHYKQEFEQEIKKNHGSQLPIIIATDVLGHFNTTVLLDGKTYILDSLPYVQGQYDQAICEAICYYYKRSFLKE